MKAIRLQSPEEARVCHATVSAFVPDTVSVPADPPEDVAEEALTSPTSADVSHVSMYCFACDTHHGFEIVEIEEDV